jgi:cytochrome c biogenesis protein CcdA
MSTIIYSLSLSLFDSLSTTQQIIIFVLLLTTAKPLRNALSYLAGLSGAYFICGLAGYLQLDRLRIFVSQFFPSTTTIPNLLYYQAEFLSGLIMIALGVWYFNKKKGRMDSHILPGRVGEMIILKLQTMNGLFAFGLGVFISVTSFPTSIPYLIALGKYSTLLLKLPAAIGCILLYNFGYALPMIIILFIYLIAIRGTDDHKETLQEKAKMLNVQLTTWTLVGFGLFSMIDAGCYFALGQALIKGRYF